MTRFLSRSLVAALALAMPFDAAAQSKVTLVPSASVSSVYDDNLFAKTVGSGDQMTLITPGVELTYETPTNMLMGEFTLDMQRSLDHPALNNPLARRHAMLDSRFGTSPRLTLGLGARYDRTDTAGELNYNTGLLLDHRTASRWEAGPSLAFKATQFVTINANYNWTSENVDDSVAADEQVARLGFTRQTSERGSFGISSLGRYFSGAGPAYTSAAALGSYTYELAPATMFTLQAGPRYSQARGSILPEIVFAVGRKAATVMNWGFDYWRGESIILGVLGPVEVNSATGKVSWPIRQKYTVGLHAGLFDSQTLTQGQVRVYHGEVVASWTTRAPFIIAASYGADFQRGDVRSSLLSDKQIVRHVILLRLTAAPRLSRSFQPDDPLQPLGGEPTTKGVKR
jgi:hypothetical protein